MFIVSNDFHDGVNDLNVSANESIFSSFVCRMTHMKMLLNVNKNAKIVIESELRANVRFLTLMDASSRYWSSIHANECVFSRNEQQKVYKKNGVSCKTSLSGKKNEKRLLNGSRDDILCNFRELRFNWCARR